MGFSLIIPPSLKQNNTKIYDFLLPGMMFEVIVTRKHVNDKKIEVLLRNFVCFSIKKYEVTNEKITSLVKALRNEKKAIKKLEKIHKYNVFGVLNSLDLVNLEK